VVCDTENVAALLIIIFFCCSLRGLENKAGLRFTASRPPPFWGLLTVPFVRQVHRLSGSVLAQACQAAGIEAAKRRCTGAVVGDAPLPLSAAASVPLEVAVSLESGAEGDDEGNAIAQSPVFDTAGPVLTRPAASAEEDVSATTSDSEDDRPLEIPDGPLRQGLLAESLARWRTTASAPWRHRPVASLTLTQTTIDHLLRFLGACAFHQPDVGSSVTDRIGFVLR
jgi:hypothetical protein